MKLAIKNRPKEKQKKRYLDCYYKFSIQSVLAGIYRAFNFTNLWKYQSQVSVIFLFLLFSIS